MKSIFATIYILIFSISVSIAQPAEIYSVDYPGKKIINMGVAYLGDSLFTDFVIKNNTISKLYIRDVLPTFAIYKSNLEKDPNEFNLFENKTFQKVLGGEFANSDTIRIQYVNFTDTTLYKPGTKYAGLIIGLARDTLLKDLARVDTFLLKAKTSTYYLSSWDDYYDFDSVYVNPGSPPEYSWTVKNIRDKDITALYLDDSLLTNSLYNTEFAIEDAKLPTVFHPYDKSLDWKITYSPKDIGVDSSLYRVFFKPQPEENPDSLNYAWTVVSGRGVQYDLSISSSNFDYSKDTLFIGDVLRNTEVEITLGLEHHGNLPFGSRHQSIQKLDGTEATNANVISTDFSDGRHLRDGEKASIRFRMKESEYGYFIYKLVIDGDFIGRDIHGIPGSKLSKTIYFMGNAKEALLKMPADTVDFGNVVLNREGCASMRDTVFRIANVGSLPVNITNVFLSPEFPKSRFNVSRRSFTIAPNTYDTITVNFTPGESVNENYVSLISFIYKKTSDLDTATMVLTGKSVPPVSTDIIMPEKIKIRPGSAFSYPIKLIDLERESVPSRYARFFTATIIVDNPSLLDLENRITVGTASEGSRVKIIDQGDGIYDMVIQNENDYFNPSDTLINLIFRAYLGDAAFTTISLDGARFADDVCDNILNIENVSATVVELDSICGLDYKIQALKGNIPGIIKLSPLPASQYINVEIDIHSKSFSELIVYDSFGEIVAIPLAKELPYGNYTFRIETASMRNGLYFLEFKGGSFRQIKNFIIYR